FLWGGWRFKAFLLLTNSKLPVCWQEQGRTDNSWGPRAIGDHGAPVSLPKLKKAYEKGTRGISWGPLLTPGPQAVPEFPNGQSSPGQECKFMHIH
ncbi:unnamed protein product, partial [Staurois parvus]